MYIDIFLSNNGREDVFRLNFDTRFFARFRFSLDTVVPVTLREMNFLDWYMFPERRDLAINTTKKLGQKMLWYVHSV